MPKHPHMLRPGMTLAELVIVIALSSVAMLTAFALVPAYGYSSTEIRNMRPLRAEAQSIHLKLQDWFPKVDYVAAFYGTSEADMLTNPETAYAHLWVWMGDEINGIYNNEIEYNEIELLEFNFEWKPLEGTFVGTVYRHYNETNDNPVPPNGDGTYNFSLAEWNNGLESDKWSDNVYRFLLDVFPSTGANRKFFDIRVSLLDFSSLESDLDSGQITVMPPQYGFQTTFSQDKLIQPL